MSSDDSTHAHFAQYKNDAENLIHIIMNDDFEKQIDLLKKYGPSSEEYVRQIAETVQHIRQLQFLCISSGKEINKKKDHVSDHINSTKKKDHVCDYLNDPKRKATMETAIKYFFEQFVRPDKPPPEIILELYRLFQIVECYTKDSSDQSEYFGESHPLNRDNMKKKRLMGDVSIWKNAFESSGRNKVQRALGSVYYELAKFVGADRTDIEHTLTESG